MHAKSSLTTACTKLGCSYTDKNPMYKLYMPIKLCKLIVNPLCSYPCRVIFAPCSSQVLSLWILRSPCFKHNRLSKRAWGLPKYLQLAILFPIWLWRRNCSVIAAFAVNRFLSCCDVKKRRRPRSMRQTFRFNEHLMRLLPLDKLNCFVLTFSIVLRFVGQVASQSCINRIETLC